jgi:signal transduction histidine kinase
MTQAQPTHASRWVFLQTLGHGRELRKLSPEAARLAPVFVPVLGCAAVVVCAAAWRLGHPVPSAGTIAGILTLLVIATLAEAYPIPIEGVSAGRTSLASVLIVAAAVLYGWAPATLLAATAMATVELGRRRPPSRVLYNTSNYVLAAAAAGAAVKVVEPADLATLAVATLAGWTAFYLVNVALLVAVSVRSGRGRLSWVCRSYLATTAAPAAILASFAVIVVALWDRSPFLILALLIPLAVIAYHERWLHASLYRLRELDRMKDEFVAVVSHELRTPLASVYGAAMTLQRPDLDGRLRGPMLAIVYRDSARLAHLVDQVLWASRLESGRVETPVEQFDGARLATEVVDSARAHLDEGVSLELHEPETLPPVVADPEKVRHVLANLVENAVKYSPDGGQIEIELEPVGSCVRFSVKDEGLGVPREEYERIFEKFHRLDPHLSRGVEGTGLGLYICRQLVQQMDGRIWVRSREGQGSTFAFELPTAGRPDGAAGG